MQAVPIVPAGYRPHGGDTPTADDMRRGSGDLGATGRRERRGTDGAEEAKQFRRQRHTHGLLTLKRERILQAVKKFRSRRLVPPAPDPHIKVRHLRRTRYGADREESRHYGWEDPVFLSILREIHACDDNYRHRPSPRRHERDKKEIQLLRPQNPIFLLNKRS